MSEVSPQGPLTGKRILVTQADAFMGPVLCEVLREQGATVIASHDDITDPNAPGRIVRDAGPLDALVANLAVPAPTTRVGDVGEQEWRHTFAALVDPLPRFIQALLPGMVMSCEPGYYEENARQPDAGFGIRTPILSHHVTTHLTN